MYQQGKEYADAIKAFKRMLQIAWYENDQHHETKAYEYLALQYFYLQQLDKAQVYKLKAFHGDVEGDESDWKRTAMKARLNYKKEVASSMGLKPLNIIKALRQHTHVERTAISKISSRTNLIGSYLKMKEQIKKISEGPFFDMCLDKIIPNLTRYKIHDRVIRISSPLNSKKFKDEVPSPAAKSYES